MKTILIIGGAGYIGSILSKDLIKNRNKVIVIDNLIYGHKKPKIKNRNFIFLKKDQTVIKKLNYLKNKIDTAVILSGLVGDPITKRYSKLSKKINNFDLKKTLFQLKKIKVNNLIFVSTCSNYGISKNNVIVNEKSKLKPVSLYAKDKVSVETFISRVFFNSKINSTILRFATAFGHSERMRFDLTINEFTKTLYEKKNLLVYDPYTWRPYCHVKDFSQIIIKIINSNPRLYKNQIFNCGDNKNNYSKIKLIKTLKKFFPKGKIEFNYRKTKDLRNYKVNFKKLKNKLNVKINYDIEYGIKEMINHLKKKNYKKTKDNFGNYLIR